MLPWIWAMARTGSSGTAGCEASAARWTAKGMVRIMLSWMLRLRTPFAQLSELGKGHASLAHRYEAFAIIAKPSRQS
jgi:hypothetical protein